MKTDNHNRNEPNEKRHYKKKFILRKHQEQEAQEEIKEFKEENENLPDGGEPPTNVRE